MMVVGRARRDLVVCRDAALPKTESMRNRLPEDAVSMGTLYPLGGASGAAADIEVASYTHRRPQRVRRSGRRTMAPDLSQLQCAFLAFIARRIISASDSGMDNSRISVWRKVFSSFRT